MSELKIAQDAAFRLCVSLFAGEAAVLCQQMADALHLGNAQ